MPIINIKQPEVIQIDDILRLRKFDNNYEFALKWYQHKETVKLVDGVESTYDYDQLSRMYHYLNDKGELYFIEIYESGKYITIGDVTFWNEDMPIVIGDCRYRHKGIGKKVVEALIKRGRELGYNELFVREIYDFNLGSINLFKNLGFKAYKDTEKGKSYRLELK